MNDKLFVVAGDILLNNFLIFKNQGFRASPTTGELNKKINLKSCTFIFYFCFYSLQRLMLINS
jgi:hypothetical protein